MKNSFFKFFIAMFVVISIFALTACGGGGGGSSSSNNPVSPTPSTGVGSVKINLTNNGNPVNIAKEKAFLYTPEAALNAGINNLNANSLRAIFVSTGVYRADAVDNGIVHFENIPAGSSYIFIASDGEYTAYLNGIKVEDSDTNPAPKPVSMTKTGSVSGNVIISNGDSASDAIVYLENTNFVAKANQNGSYSISNIPYGHKFKLYAKITKNDKEYKSEPLEVALSESVPSLDGKSLTIQYSETSPNATATVSRKIILSKFVRESGLRSYPISFADYLVKLVGANTTISTSSKFPEDLSTDNYTEQKATSDYLFKNVPAGTYSIVVIPTDEEGGNGCFGSIGNVVVNEGEKKIVDEVIKVELIPFRLSGGTAGNTCVLLDETGFITQKSIDNKYNSLTQVCSLSLCITQYLDGNTWKDYETPLATETITNPQLFPFAKEGTEIYPNDYYYYYKVTNNGQMGTLTMTRFWKCQYSGLNGSYTYVYYNFVK